LFLGVGQELDALAREDALEVPGLGVGQLDVRVPAARRGDPEAVALEHDRRRRLVAHDAPHLVEDRGEGGVLGIAADERARHLPQAVGEQALLALARVEPDVLQGHGGGPRQRGERPHVLLVEAARLVERVQEAQDPRPPPHGDGQHGAHAALLDGRVVERVGGGVVRDVGLAGAQDEDRGGAGVEAEPVLRHPLAGGVVARAAGDQLAGLLVVERELAGLRAHGGGGTARHRVVALAHVLVEQEQGRILDF
jgi:hypothetical protein